MSHTVRLHTLPYRLSHLMLTTETKHFIYFYLGQTAILLFKYVKGFLLQKVCHANGVLDLVDIRGVRSGEKRGAVASNSI